MKNRKWIPIILMIWPYLTAGAIFTLLATENQSAGVSIVLLGLLTIVVYVVNIVNACTYKREDAGRQAFWNMLVKLVHIPFYLVMFVLGLMFLAASALPALIFVSPFIVIMCVIIDYCLMVTSSMYGINALIRARTNGLVSTKFGVFHTVLHFLFFLDMISAIIIFIKIRKSTVKMCYNEE